MFPAAELKFSEIIFKKLGRGVVKLNTNRFYISRMPVLVAAVLFYASTAFSAVPQIINYQGSLSDSGGNPVNATLNMTFSLYDVPSGAGTTLWQETQSVDVNNGVFNVQLGTDTVGNPLSPSIFNNPIYLGVQVDSDSEMTPRQRVTSAAFAIRSQTVENDTLNSLSCGNGEVPKWNGGAWACASDDNSGDITGVTAGTGLTGGGTSGDVNVAADTTFLQRRVGSGCPGGSSIRAIEESGAVECLNDANTTYSAGSGLFLSGTTFLIPANGVNSVHLAPGSVGQSEIAVGSVTSAEVQDNSLTAADLAPNSIGQAEIATSGVGTAEIAASAVGSNEVQDNSLTGADIANDSLSNLDINNEAGADYTILSGTNNFLLGASDVTVRTVTITAPTSGFVIASASGYFFRSGVDADGACVITLLGNSSESSFIFVGNVSADTPRMPFGATRGFNVPSGNTTFSLICNSSIGIRVINPVMTALFVPTLY